MSEHRDRILDWREELRRMEPELPNLPLGAQRAVRETLERFAIEDAQLERERLALGEAA